jgi:hypothetical protein
MIFDESISVGCKLNVCALTAARAVADVKFDVSNVS